MATRTNRSLITLGGGVLAVGLLGTAFLGYRSWSNVSDDNDFAAASEGSAARNDDVIRALERAVEENSTNVDAHLQLANAYLQKAREYGDPTLYSATENLLKKAAQLDPSNPEVFATQSILASARHDFAEALVLGRKALEVDPERARYWGTVADAQLELGQYEEAIASLQEMVDRRPDFASYSRVSYARELYGDTEGAIEAMQWAIEAGSANPADVAWAHSEVGDLYLNINNVAAAKGAYAAATRNVEQYHGALAGQAKVAIAEDDLDTAAKLYADAFARVPLSEYAIALGELNAQLGNQEQADRQFALVRAIDALAAENGVNTELELVLFELNHGTDSASALNRARAVYAEGPNIHAADALAWALFRNGEFAEAERFANEALALGTRDPLKLFHAAEIFRARGNGERAFTLIEEAVRLNPNFSLFHRDAAARALAELRIANSQAQALPQAGPR